jgi:hypothetical protein
MWKVSWDWKLRYSTDRDNAQRRDLHDPLERARKAPTRAALTFSWSCRSRKIDCVLTRFAAP